MVGARPPGRSKFRNLRRIFDVSNAAREGGSKGFSAGGVGGRGTGPRDGANFATCVVFLTFLTRTKRRKFFFLKDTLWGGVCAYKKKMMFFEGCPVGWGYPPELA